MSGCLPFKSDAPSCGANSTTPGESGCRSTRPTHAAPPLQSLVSYFVKHSSIPPLISTSRLYAPYCSLTVPLLDEVLSNLPLLRLPMEIIASSSERCEADALWERVSDGELTGDGWGQVDVRLLDDSAAVLGEGRFSHIFVHVASGTSKIEKAVERFLPSLKKGGALVVTSWDGSWDQLLQEGAKTIGRRHTHLPEISAVVRETPVQELREDSGSRAATGETAEWAGSIAVAEWDVGEVLNWIQEDREVATAGWSLVDKACFEQALRKIIMQVAAEDGIMELNAAAVICTKP